MTEFIYPAYFEKAEEGAARFPLTRNLCWLEFDQTSVGRVANACGK